MKLFYTSFSSKIILVFAVFFIFSSVLNAQVNVQWESRYNNTSAVDQATDMVVDANGNVYVTGVSFDGTSFNIVTIKYDNTGNQLWINTYDGSANGIDEPGGIALDSNDDVYFTGYTFIGGSDYDIITRKINGVSGNTTWTVIHNGTGNFDVGNDIVIDSQDGIYITGQLEPGIGNADMITIKYDASGNQIWSNTYTNGTSAFDVGIVIVADDLDNVYMVGYSENGGDETDYLIRKYNSAGTSLWTQRYDNTSGPDQPTAAYFDNFTNNLIVTGSSLTSIPNKEDYWTLSLNGNNGTMNWDNLYNGTISDDDVASSVQTDTVGNVYVTGKSKGIGTNFDYLTIRYDVLGNEVWTERYQVLGNGLDAATDIKVNDESEIFITGYSYDAVTNNDYLTVKYDSSGTEEWSTRFDGPASDVDNALKMAIDPVGNIYVTGNSRGNGTNWDYSTIKYCQHKTNAGLDTSLCIGESVQLNAQADNGNNFTWTDVSGDAINVGVNFSCNPCNNPIVSPTQTSVYAVSSDNGNGCVDVDTIEIVVNPLPGPSIYNDGPLSFCVGDSVTLWTDSTDAYTWSDGTNTVGTDSLITVTTSGTYTVTVEDEMGCQNTTNETVTVFNLPSIDGGNDGTICEGDSIQVTATGGVSFDWEGDPSISDTLISNPYLSPTSTMMYTVLGTDGNGCIDTGYVTITVNPEPTAPTITRLSCDSLSSSLVFGNQWVQNGFVVPGASNSTYTINNNGDYWILYTDANGCSTVSDTLFVREYDTCLLSVNEMFDYQKFNLFPNPAFKEVNIEYESDVPLKRVLIYSISGVSVYEEQVNKRKFNQTINTSDLSSGVYMVRLITDQGVLNKRLVIE